MFIFLYIINHVNVLLKFVSIIFSVIACKILLPFLVFSWGVCRIWFALCLYSPNITCYVLLLPDTECYGMTWKDTEFCGMTWKDTECCGMTWKDTECYGVTWKGAACCGMTWNSAAGRVSKLFSSLSHVTLHLKVVRQTYVLSALFFQTFNFCKL